MKANALFFAAPFKVEIKEIDLPDPGYGQLLVRTEYSGISSGTELLAFRGQIDPAMPLDETLGALSGTFEFPFQYGYSCVGVVERSFGSIPVGSRVFSFHPHQDRLVIDDNHAIPVTVHAAIATMYPLVETALQVCVDASPASGASAVVVGQGAVGILSALTLQLVGAKVIASEPKAANRKIAESVGIECVDPDELPKTVARMTSAKGVDFVVEASGNPRALSESLPLLRTDGVLVVASWYGSNRVELDLGREFHRRRLTIKASQVSNLGADEVWDRRRRSELAMKLLTSLPLGALATHGYAFQEASQAFEALDSGEDGMIHINLSYQ